MTKKTMLLLITGLIIIGFGLSSCVDNSGPSKIFTRYIYYTTSIGDGAFGSDLGFFSYTTHDEQFTQLATTSILNTTGVAKNGIVIFERDENAERRLVAQCEDGYLREVPYPVLPGGDELKYYLPPHAALDYKGHNAAWLMYEELNGPNPTKSPYLIIYNCQSDDTTIVSINTFLKNEDSTISKSEPAGDYLIISNEGSVVWFVLKLFDETGSIMGWRIVKHDAGAMDWASIPSNEEIKLIGLEFLSDNVIVKKGNVIYSVSQLGSFDLTFLSPGNMSNPYQFSRTRRELAVWTNDGISIHRYGEGNVFEKVVDFTQIDQNYGSHETTPSEKLTISPDGEIIVFGMKRVDNGKFDLFMINRDGSEITLIEEDFYFGMAVVSNEMEAE